MYGLCQLVRDDFKSVSDPPVLLRITERPVKLSDGWKNFLYWNVLTGFRARIIEAKCDSTSLVVHTSFVIPQCLKFPFLDDFSIEIGPCFTHKEYRGRGIYPYILSRIIESNQNRGRGDYYMIIEDRNVSSIRGVSKVGFRKIAKIRRDKFKRYIIVN